MYTSSVSSDATMEFNLKNMLNDTLTNEYNKTFDDIMEEINKNFQNKSNMLGGMISSDSNLSDNEFDNKSNDNLEIFEHSNALHNVGQTEVMSINPDQLKMNHQLTLIGGGTLSSTSSNSPIHDGGADVNDNDAKSGYDICE